MSDKLPSAPELSPEVAKQFAVRQEDMEQTATESATAATPPNSEVAVIDDPQTEAAVDEIVGKESDELLAIQDGQPLLPSPKRRGIFSRWWHNKTARGITIMFFLLVVGAVFVAPKSRYLALNTAGVRSSASVIVLDETTGLPLKNVKVNLGNVQAQTDREGKARLTQLRLGEYELDIKRLAFRPYHAKVTIGWGSNPLGNYKLKAVGTQYVLHITNYVSNKPIINAEAETNDANALADKNGKITLTVEDTEVATLTVRVSATGFRSETLTLHAAESTEATVRLVPAQKTIFVSKQQGTYDVYSVDLDGKNKKIVLAGTGRENSNISLVVDATNTHAALVSSREGLSGPDGSRLYNLTLIDMEKGVSSTIDRAAQIQLVEWSGNRLIYRTTKAGASVDDPQRNRLVSYNYETNNRLQLAAANQFNVVLNAQGFLYYAASSSDPDAKLGLFRIKPDGSAHEQVLKDEVWTGLWTDYNHLSLQTAQAWYTYDLTSKVLAKTTTPGSFDSYLFVEHPQTARVVWIENRDGKGVLLMREPGSALAKIIASNPGLAYPVRWLDDKTLIYRGSIAAETADYVVSIEGGEAHKIAEVTPTFGFTQ